MGAEGRPYTPGVLSDHAGPRSLRQLLDAVMMIGSDLDLHAMLHRITEAAVTLVDARYGALGVLDESRSQLEDFITVGVDDETHRAIGNLPKGLGLLGYLITDAEPLRLADLRDHPNSVGFPPNHPPMQSFLGVPIRVRNEVFGNLYLTDKQSAEVFTDIDEELVLGLAAAAGVAIENARLYEYGRRREAALDAMRQVATALLAGTDSHESIRLVASAAGELVGAESATIALPDASGDSMVIEVAEGPLATDLLGARFPRSGSVSGEVLSSGETVILEDASQDYHVRQPQVSAGDTGPAIFVALRSGGGPFGTLAVARGKGEPAFAPNEIELVQSFAAQASVVLELDRSRQQAQKLTLLEDQERIARDLHDTVIQRLFACGLSLQGATRLILDPEARRRVEAAVEELDITVRHIRTVIFDVGTSATSDEGGLRNRVIGMTREAGRMLGFEPRVVFDGPVDAAVPDRIADELIASLQEALSNVVRHAAASRVDVELAVGQEFVLRVSDDGIGIPPDADPSGGHGLANLRARAERLHGSVTLAANDTGGTLLEWRVPASTG